jgi:hypothetical protein
MRSTPSPIPRPAAPHNASHGLPPPDRPRSPKVREVGCRSAARTSVRASRATHQGRNRMRSGSTSRRPHDETKADRGRFGDCRALQDAVQLRRRRPQPGGVWERRLEQVGDAGIKQAAQTKKGNYATGVQQASGKQLCRDHEDPRVRAGRARHFDAEVGRGLRSHSDERVVRLHERRTRHLGRSPRCLARSYSIRPVRRTRPAARSLTR